MLYIRDSIGDPKNISRIFVRDSLGNPQEISKIYLRDSSGNPILVWDNNVVVFECLTCVSSNPTTKYYFTCGSNDINANIAPALTQRSLSSTTTPPATCAAPAAIAGTQVPEFNLNKNYWSKVACSYEEARQGTGNIENTTSSSYYKTLKQTFDVDNRPTTPNLAEHCFAEHCKIVVKNATTTVNTEVIAYDSGTWLSKLHPKLIEAFDKTTNYPIIPGYIVVDYMTGDTKSTVFVLHRKPVYVWNEHGKNLRDSFGNIAFDPVISKLAIPDGAYNQDLDLSEGAPTRDSSIYPFYNRPVIFNLTTDLQFASDLPFWKCGQEYCGAVYGTDFYNFWTNDSCLNWYKGILFNNNFNQSSNTEYWGQDSFNYFYPGIPNIGFCSADGTTPGVFEQRANGAGVINNSNGNSCSPESRDFVKSELNNPSENSPSWSWNGINPFSWILYAEDVATGKTLPTVSGSPDIEDCCKNCFYGPISFDGTRDADNNIVKNACRHVYQIPPVNAGSNVASAAAQAGGWGLQFFRDIIVGAALNSKNKNLKPGQQSFVKLRFTLPVYVSLHASFTSKIVKMTDNETEIQDFRQNGNNGSLSIADATIYNAISSFIGIQAGSPTVVGTTPLNLSSHGFYYEENRFGDPSVEQPQGIISSSIPSLPVGIAGVDSANDLGQFPLLWWSHIGFPNENHTHYIVFEVEITDDESCISFIDLNNLIVGANGGSGSSVNVHNIIKIIKGISFYPLHFTNSLLENETTASIAPVPLRKDFHHPAFLNYIIPTSFTVTGLGGVPIWGEGLPGPAALAKVNQTADPFGLGSNTYLDIGFTNALPADQGGSDSVEWIPAESSSLTRRVSNGKIRIPNYYIYTSLISLPSNSYSCINYFYGENKFTYAAFLDKYYPAPINTSFTESSLPLFRFIDGDIYSIILERNSDGFSIDNHYPEFPFTANRTLENFADLMEFENVSNNINNWGGSLAGRPFIMGAQGKRIDIGGAEDYIGEIFQSDGSADEEIQWVNAWKANTTLGASESRQCSFYEFGESARRGADSKRVTPSSLHKYQWFDFTTNEVKGSNKYSIAAAYGGSTYITENGGIDVPRTGYTTTPGRSGAIYDLFLRKPTVQQLQDKNPTLVTTDDDGNLIAPIRELFGLADGGKYVSIDQSTDQVLATLDDKGTIRILYSGDGTAEAIASTSPGANNGEWQWLQYFDKDWIAEGFLTDETGEPVFIENKDFVSVTATLGLTSNPIYIWCLHKSGKLYGVELKSTMKAGTNNISLKKQKFVIDGDPASGIHPDFGTANVGSGLSHIDPYGQVYTTVGGIKTAVPNGTCKEIGYILNLIPKVNGVRFPVISVYGNYANYGILTCVDPNYEGYIPKVSDNFKHPVQMCEILELWQKNRPNSCDKLVYKLKRYASSYDSASNTWTHFKNPEFDAQLYKTVFGVTITKPDGTKELVYVPPRAVTQGRFVVNAVNSSPGSTTNVGVISILSNNGTWTPLASADTFVPFKFDPQQNPNFVSEMNTLNKLTVQGSFTLNSSEWDYNRWGYSSLFNKGFQGNSGYDRDVKFKFGEGPNPTNPFGPAALGQAGNFIDVTQSYPLLDKTKIWAPSWKIGQTSFGWGNPPPDPDTGATYMPQYHILKHNDANTNFDWSGAGIPPEKIFDSMNYYGFSYFDYFGNPTPPSTAELGTTRPEHLFIEGNYINNNHIVSVTTYKDSNGNYFVNTDGSPNPNYQIFGNVIPVLSIADSTKLNNCFVWIRAVADYVLGIRQDGTVDNISFRVSDQDGAFFDPFTGPCYPNRSRPGGGTFEDVKPQDYDDKLNQMKNVGSYEPGSYPTYNYHLPDVY